MNKFSRLFSVILLCSSVAAFAGNDEDGLLAEAKSALTAAQEGLLLVSPTATADDKKDLQKKIDNAKLAFKKAQLDKYKADYGSEYVAKVVIFANSGKEKVKAGYEKFSNVFVTGDKFKAANLEKDPNFFAKSKFYTQNTLAFVAPKAALFAVVYGAYKFYKNYKNVEDADLFEDEEENAE